MPAESDRPFEIGDKVRLKGTKRKGEVIAFGKDTRLIVHELDGKAGWSSMGYAADRWERVK